MVKPGTISETIQSKTTFIRNANIPRVKIDMGRAIICKMGRMKVFITPKTIAATNAD